MRYCPFVSEMPLRPRSVLILVVWWSPLALPYPRQTAEKQQRLQKLLGGFAPVAPLRTMAEPWHYRNKAIASFATQQGKLVQEHAEGKAP